MKFGNIAAEIPTSLPNELVEVLAEGEGKLRIERIVSRGHATPPDSWYEQTETEWVMLVSGVAVLKFEADDRIVEMTAGDWIEIPPGKRHRIESTAAGVDSIWLAVFWEPLR
ncbi:MAG: cupin domain-containing protein [Verrucomicrobiales bacterium]